MKKWMEWFSKEHTKGDKKLTAVFCLGIAGMLLILLSDVLGSGKDGPTEIINETRNLDAYTQQLEQELQNILTEVSGAGQTRVMLTLESSEETVYAADRRTQENGGETETKHILLDTQQGEDALVEMIWQPGVRGVAVVCEGGEDIRVASQITQIVSVLLGVPTNRISVAKMS